MDNQQKQKESAIAWLPFHVEAHKEGHKVEKETEFMMWTDLEDTKERTQTLKPGRRCFGLMQKQTEN